MEIWRSALSPGWPKVLAVEEDHEELEVKTSRTGQWTHLSTEEVLRLTKDHAAWRSVVHHAANVHGSE